MKTCKQCIVRVKHSASNANGAPFRLVGAASPNPFDLLRRAARFMNR